MQTLRSGSRPAAQLDWGVSSQRSFDAGEQLAKLEPPPGAAYWKASNPNEGERVARGA